MILLNGLLSSALVQALGLSLFHFLWQGALIAVAAAVALKFTARARTRYAIACCALVAMPAVVGITLQLSIPHAQVVISRLHFSSARPIVILPVDTTTASRDFSAYFEYAVPLWLAGVFSVLLYRSAGWISATRLRRRGTCEAPVEWTGRLKILAARARVWQPVVLLESCLAEVPIVIGYLRPAILVPAGMITGLPTEHVEAILLHELAHIWRADYLIALLQSAIEGLLFYHPGVWWISGRIRVERENCCDDFAVAIQGDPHTYATALATLEEKRWYTSEPALAANDGDLVRRIRRILRASDARDFSLPVIPAAIVLIAAGFAVADQAPPLALPFKIPLPQILPLKQPLRIARPLMAQTQEPNASRQAEIPAAYQTWLNEEVVYIISDAERKAFKTLSTDEEREKFIEQFWLRRDPTPGTPQNEFREEHYRRIAHANGRFASSIFPGWKTDRGRIYIQYGPADEIESHPSGGNYRRPIEQGGGTTTTVPFEQWRYRQIEGIGNNVIIEFVDPTRSGDYRMTMDPNAKEGHFSGPALSFPIRHLAVVLAPPNAVIVSVPLDFPTSVNIYGRASNSSGFTAAWFEKAVPNPTGELLDKKMNLPPGSYTINVLVNELKSGATYSESVHVDVK
jgi:GWxTD domain-containing protein